MFDCIIVTASDQRQAGSYQREFEHRVRSGIVSANALIVCVPDPVGARIGSGGATLNALQAGIGALWSKLHPGVPIAADSHWLRDKRFLILHSGGDSQRMPICSVRGKAFCALPSVADECETALNAPIDFLLRSFDRLTSTCNGGCWVASTDVLLLMELQHTSYEWPSEGVCGLAIAVDKRLGPNHGVFHIDSAASNDNSQRSHAVKAYVQKGSVPYLESVGAVQNEHVLLDSGIVYLSASFMSDFLLCAQQSPIDVATADGIARFPETEPMRFELYSDVMLALNGLLSYDQYLDSTIDGNVDPSRMKAARQVLWSALNRHTLYTLVAVDGHFAHLGTVAEYQAMLHDPSSVFASSFHLLCRARCFIDGTVVAGGSHDSDAPSQSPDSAVVLNSVLCGENATVGNGALIEDCELHGSFSVAEGALVSGIYGALGSAPLHCPPRTVMQQTPIDLSLAPKRLQNLPRSTNICTLSVFGIDDGIKHRVDMSSAQFCGRPWSAFLNSNVNVDDVWPGLAPNLRTLWRAALYPLIDLDAEIAPQLAAATWWLSALPSDADISAWLVSPRLSLYDIFHCSDSAAAAAWRCDTLSYKIDLKRCARQLISRGSQPVLYRCAAAFVDACARGNEHSDSNNPLEEWCTCLERIALESIDSNSDDVTARSLSLVGAALHAACGPVHSHSSTSCVYNESAWNNALSALSSAVALSLSVNSALQSLFSIRSKLLGQLHSVDAVAISAILSEVSRFYDSASQLFIRRRVERDVSIEQVNFPSPASLIAHGSWARVTACARVDLAGGWSDTPPIAYEHGGCVLNVAVMVDGHRPIGAQARRRCDNEVILRLSSRPPHNDSVLHQAEDELPEMVVHCRNWLDVADYDNPLAPAALLKAALVASGWVRPDQSQWLLGGGVEVCAWSQLPRGSGLGTSSILAACVIRALSELTPHTRLTDARQHAHAVLRVEQLMSCGGGWQDQVGGVLPGFKLTYSSGPRQLLPPDWIAACQRSNGFDIHSNSKPPHDEQQQVSTTEPHQLCVWPQVVSVDPDFCRTFGEHLLLIYTGVPRLAKNLLQSVLRRWHARTPEIVAVVDDLCDNARAASVAVQQGDLSAMGACLDAYWLQKKTMATDAESPLVATMMLKLRPLSHGISLCGAGGGGFLVAITKEPAATIRSTAERALSEELSSSGATLHTATIDASHGLVCEWVE